MAPESINPNLAELHGDHYGYDGFRSFFERLHQESDSGFHNEPHSLTPHGDELVVAYATNTLSCWITYDASNRSNK